MDREPGSLCKEHLDRVGKLHEWLLRESTLYRHCIEMGLLGLASALILRELERGEGCSTASSAAPGREGT